MHALVPIHTYSSGICTRLQKVTALSGKDDRFNYIIATIL